MRNSSVDKMSVYNHKDLRSGTFNDIKAWYDGIEVTWQIHKACWSANLDNW